MTWMGQRNMAYEVRRRGEKALVKNMTHIHVAFQQKNFTSTLSYPEGGGHGSYKRALHIVHCST
eukprot:scaffold5202_cov172-Skeletonema_marinoi.AAC.2